MMNGLMYFIRIAILLLVIFLVIILKKKRRLALLICLIVVVLLCLSLLIPPEHFIVRFKTPIDAYCYSNFGYEIVDVLYGEETALILSKNRGGTYSVWVTQKDMNGYMIPVFGSLDIVQNNGTIQTLRLKNTNDYYYYGLIKDQGAFSTSDYLESYTLPTELEGYVFCYGKCQGDGSRDTQE